MQEDQKFEVFQGYIVSSKLPLLPVYKTLSHIKQKRTKVSIKCFIEWNAALQKEPELLAA